MTKITGQNNFNSNYVATPDEVYQRNFIKYLLSYSLWDNWNPLKQGGCDHLRMVNSLPKRSTSTSVSPESTGSKLNPASTVIPKPPYLLQPNSDNLREVINT